MGTDPVEQTDEEFLEWLRDTLIPDLHESGQENLVADFERLIRMVEVLEEYKKTVVYIVNRSGV
jgi:hypothetical protein